jgi:hypothetical protein
MAALLSTSMTVGVTGQAEVTAPGTIIVLLDKTIRFGLEKFRTHIIPTTAASTANVVQGFKVQRISPFLGVGAHGAYRLRLECQRSLCLNPI